MNDQQAPTGRPAESLGWAGRGNLFFCIDRRNGIDRQNGIGGFWATQILPFFDQVSLDGFLEQETATYQHLS